MSGCVRVTGDGGVAVVTLDRPEVRNALSTELLEDLGDTVTDLDADESVGAIVLTGADPAFCSGFDLRKLSTGSDPGPVRADMRGLLPEHATPVIGAINGAAVTGGLELALSCDFLVASVRARFADTHALVGAMPGAGLTIRLPELIGIDRARRMSITGEFVDAARAYEWGLVTEVVAHDELRARAVALASAVASIPRANVREVRRMYTEIGAMSGPTAWRRENELARRWMATRFDRGRLATTREAIIERGRERR